MQRHRRATVAVTVATAILVASACGDDSDSRGPAESTTEDSPTEVTMTEDSATEVTMTEDSATEVTMTDRSAAEESTPVELTEDTAAADPAPEPSAPEETAVLASWQTIEITDVSGDTFTLADYVGTPMLVETFATWCSKCRAQLIDTQQAASTLADEGAVVALSVETDLSPDDVAEYAASNGFSDIRFAVMSPELLAAFADAFGTTVANPPSTPKIIVDATGQPGELSTGPASVDDIVADVRAAA